jgi:type I restriction enzyme S subunit
LHEVVGLNGLFSDGDWILSQNMDDEGSIRLLQLADVGVGTFLNKSSKFINEQKEQELKCTSVMAGDILISRMGDPIARACVVPDLGQKAIAAVDLSIVRVDPRIADARYIVIVCNSWIVRNQAERLGRGTTRKRISRTHLEEVKIPLPPLPIQKQIASILDKADAVRKKRRQANQLAEQFIHSTFLEMFGDPVANPRCWEVVELGALLTFVTSGSRGWAKHYTDQGDKFLRIQNVGRNRLLLDDIAYVSPSEGAETRRTMVKEGDVLLSITADLGRTCVIPHNFGPAYINQHLMILRAKDIHPGYLCAYLASEGGASQIRRLDRQGVKSGLNFDDIRSLKIVRPDKLLQEEYVGVVQKVDSLMAKQKESEKELENLFNSLMQRAFRGELV